MLNFEWDEAKAQTHLAKHSVSFKEAASAFGDPLALTFPDPDHSVGEKRWLTFSVSQAGRVLVVVHTNRGRSIRIISARKTTRHERGIRVFQHQLLRADLGLQIPARCKQGAGDVFAAGIALGELGHG